MNNSLINQNNIERLCMYAYIPTNTSGRFINIYYISNREYYQNKNKNTITT